MNSPKDILPASAMPIQRVPALSAGASSPQQSAQIQQQQQIDKQMALIGTSTGGSKSKRRGTKRRGTKRRGTKRRGTKRRKLRGGANAGVANNAEILVPSVQAGAVNSEQTAGQYADLTTLASTQQSQAVYDTGNTAAVAATQQGGRKMKKGRNMKGGTWPIWGCLSGGKQSRRKNRRHKKNKKNTKNKRRHH